jgi:hypothetical protein
VKGPDAAVDWQEQLRIPRTRTEEEEEEKRAKDQKKEDRQKRK